MRGSKLHFAAMICPLLLATSSCTADGGDDGQLEFRGEQAFIPGLNVDTGWIPERA